MAHLWTRNADDEWAGLPLDADAFSRGEAPPCALPQPGKPSGATTRVALVRTSAGSEETWNLIAGEARRIHVNGLPLTLGFHVVRDRDEIRIDTVGRLFFSSERLPTVEPFPGAEPPIYCPRCKSEIRENTLAVKCPRCSVVHHEDESVGFLCWSYAETCALCPQPTSRREFSWSPRGL
jgi:hypothetical protein